MESSSISAGSAAPAGAVPAASLPDPDDGFVLSIDDPNHPANFTKPSPSVDKLKCGGKGSVAANQQQEPQYILGTLIVRVVAAKHLELPSHAGGGGGGLLFGVVGGVSIGGGNNNNSRNAPNPYASVKFGTSTQRSSEVFAAMDPVWPRHETMFMDVALPLSQMTHSYAAAESEETTTATSVAAAASASQSHDNDNDNNISPSDDPYAGYKKPNTILTVAIFHTPEMGRIHKCGGGGNLFTGDSDDLFLGVASVDLTRLFTGKMHTLDKWLPLQGTAAATSTENSSSSRNNSLVRIVCEYEPSDIPPKQGDICKFTRFCHPKDLYPLEPGRSYKVDQVTQNGEVVLLSYESQEGWVLSFQAHKNMLICEERHVSALESAHEELQTLGERLAYSPLVATVTETAERVVDDGIVGVAGEIAKGSLSLVDRWFKGGLDTVIGDLQHVTNLDGRHNPDTRNHLELSSPVASGAATGTPPATSELDETDDDHQGATSMSEEEDEEANPFMPPCPITGCPMVDPVVAADGHTYERNAIARWLRESDKSPMTGQVLVHKELVPNYGLMSSVQEAAAREKKSAAAAAASAVLEGVEESYIKKSPPPEDELEMKQPPSGIDELHMKEPPTEEDDLEGEMPPTEDVQERKMPPIDEDPPDAPPKAEDK